MKIIEKILSENLPIDNDTFIFDIETTGLNPRFCKIILIGILYNCQDKTIIKQFFAENENDEKELLTNFIEEIYQNIYIFYLWTFDYRVYDKNTNMK